MLTYTVSGGIILIGCCEAINNFTVQPHKLRGDSGCVLQGLGLNQLVENVIFKGAFAQERAFLRLCIFQVVQAVKLLGHHQTVVESPLIFMVTLAGTYQLTCGVIGIHDQ